MAATIENAIDPVYQAELMEEIWSIKGDFLKAAYLLFPWGDINTPLARFKGPRIWHCELFEAMTDHYRTETAKVAAGGSPDVFAWTCRSGHGTGKDAVLAMFANIYMSFFPGATYITTANTEGQLMSKTMPEVCKWFRLAINKAWWDPETLIIRPARWYKKILEDQLSIDCKYHYVQGIPWNKDKAEAFTGQHNWNGTAFAKSECSGIADEIWDAIDGAWTEPVVPRYDLNVGNPWRTTGRFHESHHKLRNLYRRTHLDTRKVEDTDPKFEERIRLKHGEDSKQYEVQVKGNFPKDGDDHFIKPEAIEGAKAKALVLDVGAPLVLGFDIARMGEDSSVIMPRRGLDVTMKPFVASKRDLAWLTNWAEGIILKLCPRRVFIDGIGLGAGVADHLIDRFKRRGQVSLIVALFSNEDSEDPMYEDRRTELWGKMRDHLKFLSIGNIPELERLCDDLGAPNEETSHRGKVTLESVDDMKARKLASPDWGSALALTYYQPVPREDFGLWTPNQGRPTHAGTSGGGLRRSPFRR